MFQRVQEKPNWWTKQKQPQNQNEELITPVKIVTIIQVFENSSAIEKNEIFIFQDEHNASLQENNSILQKILGIYKHFQKDRKSSETGIEKTSISQDQKSDLWLFVRMEMQELRNPTQRLALPQEELVR